MIGMPGLSRFGRLLADPRSYSALEYGRNVMIHLHWLPHWKAYAIRHNGRVIGMIRCAPPLPFRVAVNFI